MNKIISSNFVLMFEKNDGEGKMAIHGPEESHKDTKGSYQLSIAAYLISGILAEENIDVAINTFENICKKLKVVKEEMEKGKSFEEVVASFNIERCAYCSYPLDENSTICQGCGKNSLGGN